MCPGEGPLSQRRPFSKETIRIDPTQEVERIVSLLKQSVRKEMRRYGAVVGISGGLDSSVVLALCVRAFGPEHVVAIIMPEKESDSESETLASHVAKHFAVEPILEDITPAVEGFDCYSRRDEAIKRMIPEFDANVGYTAKIGLPGNLLESEILNVFMLTVVDPQGGETSHRIPVTELRQIVAASNFKQRTRMAFLYYHAELNHYAVIGTANKDEHDLGFFVKHGDGGVDVQPIAHLYKTQVYQLAEELGIPEVIRARVPSTDTYSAGGTQQEFFFRVPFDVLDLIWQGHEGDVSQEEIAEALNLSVDQVRRVVKDIIRKQKTTIYLRLPVKKMGSEMTSSDSKQ